MEKQIPVQLCGNALEKQVYVKPELVTLGGVNLIQGGIRLVPADLSAHLAREGD